MWQANQAVYGYASGKRVRNRCRRWSEEYLSVVLHRKPRGVAESGDRETLMGALLVSDPPAIACQEAKEYDNTVACQMSHNENLGR